MQKENKFKSMFDSGSTGESDSHYLKFIGLLSLAGVLIALIVIGLSTLLSLYFEYSHWMYTGLFILFILAIGKRTIAFQMEDKVMKLPFSLSTLPIKLVPILTAFFILFLYFRMK